MVGYKKDPRINTSGLFYAKWQNLNFLSYIGGPYYDPMINHNGKEY